MSNEAKRAMTLHQRTGISLKEAWRRVKGGKSSGGGGGKSHTSSPSGGGKRMTSLDRLSKAKTLGAFVNAGAEVAPTANVVVGELARIFYEKKPLIKAGGDVLDYSLRNYLAFNLDTKKMDFNSYPYDIPHLGRSPIKVGPVYAYGISLGVPLGLRVAKKIPLLGWAVRKIAAIRIPGR